MILIGNAPEIRYQDEDHSYWKDQLRIPGISELLKYFGYIDDSYYTEIPRKRGTEIHGIIADHCRGEEQAILSNDDPEVVQRIEAFFQFKAAKDFRPIGVETIHFSPLANLACRSDLIGTFGESPFLSIIEMKCGSRAGWHSLQTAGQALCFGQPVRRFALYLKTEGKFDLREHTDRTEIPIVQGLAATYWYNQKNGLKLARGA